MNRETFLGIALLAVAFLATPALRLVFPYYGRLVLVPAAAISVVWILLAYRRYFAQLDELSLRIQYEAIAFSFSVTLLLGITAAAAAAVTDFSVHPLWLAIAEPLRGLGLVLAARRYR